MSAHVEVPEVDALQAMTDAELADLLVHCADAVGVVEARLAMARESGDDSDRAVRLAGAKGHLTRGIRTIRTIQEQRQGRPSFKPAREVVDFATAISAQKAISRLLGLLWDEHCELAQIIDGAYVPADLAEAHRRVVEAVTS